MCYAIDIKSIFFLALSILNDPQKYHNNIKSEHLYNFKVWGGWKFWAGVCVWQRWALPKEIWVVLEVCGLLQA